MAKRLTKENRKLFKKAQNLLVGGVNSPVRSFNYVGTEPLLINKAKGAYVFDYDGNNYIDYVLSWGVAILGHANPFVIKELKRTLSSGLSFGTTNRLEIELAKVIQEAVPLIERIRFVNSGTEAVMGAVRLARGYTNRDKIVKFENSYHGHADYLLVGAGSGLKTLQIPSSLGVPNAFIEDTIAAPLGKIEVIENIFRKYSKEIAAVIIEPVGANYGVTLADIDYLRKLRQLTRKYNALLIFDEVITGFRFRFGSVGEEFGISPDLICLGKIIGGGLPIGAYGGKKRVMEKLAPIGGVYQASTFSGNPIVMQAGLSTLKVLRARKGGYGALKELTEELSLGLRNYAYKCGIDLKVIYYGTMFSLKFPVREQFARFYRYILKDGIFFAPSEFEANFLSFAHTKKDIDKTLKIVKTALSKI